METFSFHLTGPRGKDSGIEKPRKTVTAGSEPRRSLVLSKTALKSLPSIVGTDGSVKSRHEVKNSSCSGFRLGV